MKLGGIDLEDKERDPLMFISKEEHERDFINGKKTDEEGWGKAEAALKRAGRAMDLPQKNL